MDDIGYIVFIMSRLKMMMSLCVDASWSCTKFKGTGWARSHGLRAETWRLAFISHQLVHLFLAYEWNRVKNNKIYLIIINCYLLSLTNAHRKESKQSYKKGIKLKYIYIYIYYMMHFNNYFSEISGHTRSLLYLSSFAYSKKNKKKLKKDAWACFIMYFHIYSLSVHWPDRC